MKIIRMENSAGVGMYYNDATRNTINNGTSDDINWPMPYADSRLRDDKKAKIEYVYPDNDMLQWCKRRIFNDQKQDLINCGLFKLYDEEKYVFGFRDYAQMERWIYDFNWRVELEAGGIMMNVYEIDQNYVMIGTTQCTFRKELAKLMHSFPPTALEDYMESIMKFTKELNNENA